MSTYIFILIVTIHSPPLLMRKTRCGAAPAPRIAVCVLLMWVEFLLRSQIETDVQGLTCKHDAHVRLFQSAVNSNS
jgi:hypothetical protein